MRKVVVYELLSLDGVAEACETFITEWDDVMDANLADIISPQDTVVLGHRTYNEWSGFWPNSDVEPFASFINAVPKFVATSAPLTAGWANSTAIEGDLVEFVRGLKDRPGGDIGVHGSISVAQALLAGGVVDQVRLLIGPIVANSGRRLLDGLPRIPLELTDTIVSPTGHLLLDYSVRG